MVAAVLSGRGLISPAASAAETTPTPEPAGSEDYGGLPEGPGRDAVYFNCTACHSLDGSKKVGPSFKNLACSERQFADGSTGVADDAYLLESILEPNKKIAKGYPPAMPPMGGTLSRSKIDSAIMFLKTQSEACK